MPENKMKMIAGVEFSIRQPYESGHVCSEAEAKVLNQTRSENVGNNLRSMIQEKLDKGVALDEIRSQVEAYDAEYVFNLATVSASARRDPVEREAYNLAKDAIKLKLAETGRRINVTPDGLTDEQWAEKVATAIENLAAAPATIEEARKRVEAKKQTADALLAGLEI